MTARSPRRVVAAIIERDGKVLIGQRRRDDSHPLKWEFPGGKIEPGESPQEALQRELEEELASAIRGLHRAVEAQRQQGTTGQERVPQGARYRGGRQRNAHATHAAGAWSVQPAKELLGAER